MTGWSPQVGEPVTILSPGHYGYGTGGRWSAPVECTIERFTKTQIVTDTGARYVRGQRGHFSWLGGTQEVRYAYGASDRSFIVPPASRLAGLARHYSAAARDLQFARHQLSAVDDRRPADAADAIMAVIERLSLAAAGFAALAEADEA